MDCPHITGCEMFPLFSQRSVLNVWQTNYCHADFERCARYLQSRAGRPVPLTLLPNGKHLQLAQPPGKE